MMALMLGQLPKPRSIHEGPEPAPPPGGWPPFKGAVGPRQKKCLKNGGAWIGPTGKKWCQMGPRYVPRTTITTLDPQGGTPPGTLPNLRPGTDQPATGLPTLKSDPLTTLIEDGAVTDMQAEQIRAASPGLLKQMSSSFQQTRTGGITPGLVLLVGVGGALVWFAASQMSKPAARPARARVRYRTRYRTRKAPRRRVRRRVYRRRATRRRRR